MQGQRYRRAESGPTRLPCALRGGDRGEAARRRGEKTPPSVRSGGRYLVEVAEWREPLGSGEDGVAVLRLARRVYEVAKIDGV